jgi:TRAP-type C4-dicarboxylate transport system permease large subunit
MLINMLLLGSFYWMETDKWAFMMVIQLCFVILGDVLDIIREKHGY